MCDAVIDISHYNSYDNGPSSGPPNWTRVRAAGILGVIHKATQGVTSVDPTFAAARTAVPAAGLLWGAYHFGTGEDGSAQAEFFLDTVKPDASTLCAIDFEPNPSGTQMSFEQLLAWIGVVQKATGRAPVVYGGESLLFGDVGTAVTSALSACPLWIAQYTSAASPSNIPASVWNTWTLWQYTASGNVAGVTGDVDRSRFNGTPDELTRWWQEKSHLAA